MRILVGLSGGVDSTIAALRLKNEGHELLGCYMLLHNDKNYHKTNLQKVQKVANFLGISYEVLDLSKEFEAKVFKPFIQAYKEAKTPNPCVVCNKYIKFGTLVKYAKSLGCDRLAMGHYVRIKDGFIYEAKDKNKDQSYFLGGIDKDVLSFLMFPLGESLKTQVKIEAQAIKELNFFATQKESQEICFVPNSYVDILRKYEKVDIIGDVLNTKGEIIGTHQGYMHYTIGKRKGFNVFVAHEPHYVVSINSQTNSIIVGKKDDLGIDEFCVDDLNLFCKKTDFSCEVKVRYRSSKIACYLDVKTKKVKLFAPAYAIARGQRAVFYDGEKLIASGEIV